MKVVVIGGVAAGMSCAARTRRLDEKADIVVFERGEHVSFANCGLPYHIGGKIKERDRLLLQTPDSLRKMLNLDVRVGQEVLAIDRQAKCVKVHDLTSDRIYEEDYEKLVLAPGAAPIRPNLPGIEDAPVFVLRNVTDMDRIQEAIAAGAKSTVVIGGGYIGIEMSENLKELGLDVDLVELADQLMTPLDPEMARPLEDHARMHGVRMHLGVAAAALSKAGDQARVELVDGEMLTADFIVMAVGVRPESRLAAEAGLSIGDQGGIIVNEHLQTSDPDIYAGGDVIEVTEHVTGRPAQIPLAGPANRQGRIIADNLCGRDSVYNTTKGTAVVKVFEMTGGATGATEKRLKSAKRKYSKLYIHPSGHAGYYPGSSTMHVKVLFDPETGALLGAQVVGFDGVDKRLDVFATALAAGMTVKQLQHLELSYAPPYGSAKDPVNMAGFVASNMMDGIEDVWYAEDYPNGTNVGQLVDVRSKGEYDAWHIPGARNIPLGSLRSSLNKLDSIKPVFVYCRVGFRSYLAQRLLKQRGFDVKTLSGGTLTFCHCHSSGVCPEVQISPIVSYAEEEPSVSRPARTGRRIDLDLSGLQCPGPIRKLAEALKDADPGDEICAVASDPGFATDMPLWCKSSGNTLVSISPRGQQTEAIIRKESPRPDGVRSPDKKQKTMVVFSGDLDKVLAAFIIANGAVSMGNQMTLFFTFWGLNALRKTAPQAKGKGLLDWMFGLMMPKGARRLKLSKMNMLGAGTAMMKHVMRSKHVDSLPELIQQAIDSGVKIVACSMSMDVMGIKREELIDGIEIGGVAHFLGSSDEANMTLFI